MKIFCKGHFLRLLLTAAFLPLAFPCPLRADPLEDAADGLVLEVVTSYSPDSGYNGIPVVAQVFEYDDGGVLTGYAAFDPLDGQYKEITKYTYDEAGRMTASETLRPSESIPLDNTELVTYTYDEEEFLTRIETRRSGSFEDLEMEEYNRNGDVVRERKSGEEYRYEVDSHGNRTEEWRILEDGQEKLLRQTSYEYDSAGHLTGSLLTDEEKGSRLETKYEDHTITKTWSLPDGTEYFRTETQLDDNGRTTGEKSMTITGSVVYEAVYEYDRQGNLIHKAAWNYGKDAVFSALPYLPKGEYLESPADEFDYMIRYDEDGNIMEYSSVKNGKFHEAYQASYQDGLLVDKQVLGSDGAVTERFRYAYDDSGRVVLSEWEKPVTQEKTKTEYFYLPDDETGAEISGKYQLAWEEQTEGYTFHAKRYNQFGDLTMKYEGDDILSEKTDNPFYRTERYSYDSSRRRTYASFSNPSSSSGSDRVTYTYWNEDDTVGYGTPEQGILPQSVDILYDDAGNITYYYEKTADGETEEKQYYTYDEDGRVIREENVTIRSGAESQSEIIQTRYDVWGRIDTVISTQLSSDGVRTGMRKTTYEYTEEGSSPRLRFKNPFDRTLEIQELEYDGHGNLIRVREVDTAFSQDGSFVSKPIENRRRERYVRIWMPDLDQFPRIDEEE